MSNDKKDLHSLIGHIDEEIVIEADNSPLTSKEKEIIKQANKEIEAGDLVDWDDLNA